MKCAAEWPNSRLRAVGCCVLLCTIASGLEGGDVPTPEAWLERRTRTTGVGVRAAELRAYARTVSGVAPGVSLELLGLSTEGRPLLALRFGPPAGAPASDPNERKVLAVTCGIHSDEVGSSLTALRLIERLASVATPQLREVRETAEVYLLPCLNPDGQERVTQWIRDGEPGGRRGLPFLYHRYSGHDLNRDWLLGTQAETRAVVSGLYNRLRPVVTIDLHQMGWSGPRMFLPPYAAPHDPSVPARLFDATAVLGDAVTASLTAVGYRGIAQRWQYDAWSPARAYPFYHGGIRFLIEVASARFASDRYVSRNALHVFDGNAPTRWHTAPWSGGQWGMVEVLDYATAATEATLHAALDNRMDVRPGPARAPALVVRLDGVAGDPQVGAELLEALEWGGVELLQRPGSELWLARDPEWGRGWCRALLFCTDYPGSWGGGSGQPGLEKRSSRSAPSRREPYDTSSHDLALLAGLDASVASPTDIRGAQKRGAPRSGWNRSTLRALPGLGVSEGTVAGWLSGRSLAVFAGLGDLVELGAVVERLTDTPKEDLWPGTSVLAGDFLLEGIAPALATRLRRHGATWRTLDANALRQLRSAVSVAALAYPRVEVLSGPGASRDEGWLRWLLEDYRVRFRGVSPRHFKTTATDGASGRVVILAERLRLAHDPVLELALVAFVKAGGRVIALGRAARDCVRFAALDLEMVSPRPYLPGAALATKLPVASRGLSDPVLWGYRDTPPVFYHGGPLWRVDVHPSEEAPGDVEAVLCADSEASPLCGIGRLKEPDRGAELAIIVRVRQGAGEWLLAGFQPQVRAWPKASFRLLLNAIFAPR
jgi:hypothetical protein